MDSPLSLTAPSKSYAPPALELPNWAWIAGPDWRFHYFTELGEPSLCGRHLSRELSELSRPRQLEVIVELNCCAGCWRRLGRSLGVEHDE